MKISMILFKFWLIYILAGVWGIGDAETGTKSWNDDDTGSSSSNTSDLPTKLKYQFNSLMKQKMAENRKSDAYRSPSSSSSTWYGVEPESSEGFQPQDDNGDAGGTTSEQEIETESIDGPMDDPTMVVDHGNNGIRVAVQSKRRFEFVPVHYDREDQKAPRMIEIVSDTMPLRLHFKSQSAAIVVTQSHMSPPMKPIDETVTMDQPFRLTHKAYKPIIQDVNEIIQPYRNIVQQVKPVIEDIRTIVPQDNDIYHKHHHQRPEKREPQPQQSTRFVPEAKPKTVKASGGPLEKSKSNYSRYYNKLNNYGGILQLDQSERVLKTIENVGPPQQQQQQQQQHEIRKRMDSYFFKRRPRFNPNPMRRMDGRGQSARWAGRPDDNFMRIESSEPEMIYVDHAHTQNWRNPEMIVGDLYKDNIINREDHGLETVANLFPPSMVLMKNDDVVEHHDLLEHHHLHHHHHHHGRRPTSIFDNGDVTIEEKEEEHNANVLDYMDNGAGGPYLHHRHHLLHLEHDEDGHDHDHHHGDDQHLFATFV